MHRTQIPYTKKHKAQSAQHGRPKVAGQSSYNAVSSLPAEKLWGEIRVTFTRVYAKAPRLISYP